MGVAFLGAALGLFFVPMLSGGLGSISNIRLEP